MKSICLVTKEADDYVFVKNQQYLKDYYFKRIVYDVEGDVFGIEGQTMICGNTNIEMRVRECEAIYISRTLIEKYGFLFDYANINNIEILNVFSGLPELNEREENEVPLVAVISTFSESHRLRVIKELTQRMKKKGIRTIVFSNDCYCKAFGFVYINTESSSAGFNELCERIKDRISKEFLRNEADVAFFEFSGAWNNAFCQEDKEVSHSVFMIRKAVGIDYSVVMLPYNSYEDVSILQALRTECIQDAGTMDSFVIDNVILDCSGDNHRKEEDTEAIEIIAEMSTIEDIKEYGDSVHVLSEASCADLLCNAIVHSLTYSADDIYVM